MANRTKQNRPASVPDIMHIRVAPPIKQAYERLAKARTQPNHKNVTSADVAREALVEYLDKKHRMAA